MPGRSQGERGAEIAPPMSRLLSNWRPIMNMGIIAPSAIAIVAKTIESSKPIGHCVWMKNQPRSRITKLAAAAFWNLGPVNWKG